MSKRVSRSNDEFKNVFGNRRKSDVLSSGGADWGSVEPGLLARLVSTVTSRGGAVRFGYTRDGGAYAVGFYYGGESTSEYCRPSEDISAFLEEWVSFYEELPASGGKSPQQ